MALTKVERIEIQESAKFNYMRRLKEQEEKKQLQKQIEERVRSETEAVKKQLDRSEDVDTKKGK